MAKAVDTKETAASTKKAVDAQAELTSIAGEIRKIAAAIPTPNVTDSHAHGNSLQELANRILAVAEEL
jgi:hypothetical protein